VGAVCCCLANNTAALNAATGNQRGMDEVVIATLLARDVTDRAAELALHDDQCVVKQRSSSTSRHHCAIYKQIRQADIEQSGRLVEACIGLIDVWMIVPTAERDLNVSSPQAGPKDIARCETRIAERGVPVLLLV